VLTLQEISDRLEIQDLLVDYAYAVDGRDWDALDNVFTPDAVIDFRATGGARGDLATIKAFLADALATFTAHQHLVAASKIELAGDTATGRTMCHNPMVLDGDGGQHVMFVGLWYVDRFVRTEAGWRIQHRAQELAYLHDLPPAPAPPRADHPPSRFRPPPDGGAPDAGAPDAG
jgi:ketosteroid isomerase-like protein